VPEKSRRELVSVPPAAIPTPCHSATADETLGLHGEVWGGGFMEAPLEIPDCIFRRAKSVALEQGIPLRRFATEA
jgi:hypothetical protein